MSSGQRGGSEGCSGNDLARGSFNLLAWGTDGGRIRPLAAQLVSFWQQLVEVESPWKIEGFVHQPLSW